MTFSGKKKKSGYIVESRILLSHRKQASLTEGHVPAVLLRLSLPMIAVALGIVIFNLTDTFFVGRLGALPLAALSFTFPVVLFTGSISMGIGIGTSVTVSRALGAKDRSLAARLTTDSHLLTVIAAIVIMVAGLLTIDPLFLLLGAKSDILPMIREYMTIWYAGYPFVIVSMTSMQVIQAGGDARTPGILMVASVCANIALDPALIFGLGPFPELGITGAAIATVLARSSSMLFGIWIVAHREKLFSFSGSSIVQTVRSWGKILYIGIPAGMTNVMRPLSMGIITRLVAAHGVLAVAGFGVATRLETFALIFIMAIAFVLTPFAGQNAGAQKFRRIRQGMRYATLFSLGWSIIAFGVFIFFAGPLAAVFNDTPDVVTVAVRYLKIMAASYGFQGTALLASAAFNGLHLPWTATALAFIRMFVLYVPLAWAGSTLFGLPGLFAGAAFANVLSGIFGFGWFERRIAGHR
ncbi:MAG: MATE family efflux transporter [Chitinivibrionales bacterium]|nr:MATE family efflux transporter [Chitinivibrionales bacterium]